MADVAAVFLAVAGITLVGFLAGRLHERTGFPDIPLLLAMGLALGPVNRFAVQHGVGSTALDQALNPGMLHDLGPYMSGLGLVVILFDSGLKLDFRALRGSIGAAFLHTLPIFLLTVVGIAAVGRYVFGMSPLVAAVLGVTLSNVGQTVSAAMMRGMSLSDGTKAIGFVEMALYDLLSIPILVSMFAFAGGAESDAIGASVRGFAQLASISLVLGGVAGIVWVFALRRLAAHPHSYMLTVAVLLAVYASAHYLGGSGAVGVLVFGLMVGNRSALLRILSSSSGEDVASVKVQAFHDEINFFVRTVFFLFLGISFTINVGTSWPVATSLPVLSAFNNTTALFLVGTILVILWFVLARWISISLVSVRIRPETRGLMPVFGHGLGTAVLATLPFVAPQYVPGTRFYEEFHPWQEVFLDLALLVILVTVLLSSILIWVQERGFAQANARQEAEAAARAAARPVARSTQAVPPATGAAKRKP